MKEQGARHLPNNVREVKCGNGKAYTVSRLKRENPALFDEVKAGRMSANAAAIEAGWRKVKTPLEQVRHWLKKLTAKERAVIRAELA